MKKKIVVYTVIAYEGHQKYAVRGATVYGNVGQKDNYKADNALSVYPALKTFLIRQWNAFADEAQR